MGCLFSAGGTQQQQKHNNSPRGTTPPHPIVHIASSPAAIVTPAIRSPAPGTKVLLHPCCNCATIVADPLSSGRRPPAPPPPPSCAAPTLASAYSLACRRVQPQPRPRVSPAR